MKLKVRPAKENDLMLIFKWANDPLTRKMSFNQNPISLETHKEWFYKIVATHTHLFIVEGKNLDNWLPVAQVRVDKNGEISMSLASEFRGQHLATPVIKTVIDYCGNFNLPLKELVAHIKPENIASIKTFKRAGFHFVRETMINQHPCLEYIYKI